MQDSIYRRDEATGLVVRSGHEPIAYSDGDAVEAYLLEAVRGAKDRSSQSVELERAIRDWPSTYHLSRQRHCLLRPLPFRKGDRVLDLGCGCGALTRYLGDIGCDVVAVEGSPTRARIARERCADLPNVEIVVDDICAFRSPQSFDWVLLVGVLEYARKYSGESDPVAAVLRQAVAHLLPGGRCVVAIENKLGLAYFNGAPEDHLGAPFAGISGLYGDGTPVTFGKRELADFVARAGLPAQTFSYPFPDYKLPTVWISQAALDRGAPDPADLLAAMPPARDGGERLFSEPLATEGLAANGLIGDLANSFLLVASRQTADLPTFEAEACTYAVTSRCAELACETLVLASSPGPGEVVKRRLDGRDGVVEKTADGVTIRHRVGASRYVAGRLFVRRVNRALMEAASLSELAAVFSPWAAYLKAQARCVNEPQPGQVASWVLPGSLIDAVPKNVVETAGGFDLIDREWELVGDAPLLLVLLRGIVHTLEEHRLSIIAPGIDAATLTREICRGIGLDAADGEIDAAWRQETAIQRAVTGRDVNLDTAVQIVNPALRQLVDVRQRVAALAAEVRARDASIGERDETIRARDEALAAGVEVLRARDETIRVAQETIRARDAVIETHGQTIAALSQHISVLEGSTSWRVTAPWRWLATVVHGLPSLLPRRIVIVPVRRPGESGGHAFLIPRRPFDLPAGRYRVTFDDIGTGALAVPALRADCGAGFAGGVRRPLRLRRSGSGRLSADVVLPHGVRALRLESDNREGGALAGAAMLRRMPRTEYYGRLAIAAARKRIRAPGDVLRHVRAAGGLVAAQGLRGLAQRLHQLEGSDSAEYRYENWVALYDTIGPDDIAAMRRQIAALTRRPMISIVMPVFNAPARLLREAIESVRAQVYEAWELCIANDASTHRDVRALLDDYARRDARIKVVHRAQRGHIARASNSALALASGDWIAFLDHDDLLPPHALFCVADTIAARPDVRLIYSDEDKITEEGRRYDPYFKPDWNETLILGQNYACHFCAIQSALVRAEGGFRSGFDGAQDYDLILRCSERVALEQIVHIPHVLYHWRSAAGSTAAGVQVKDYALDAAARAVSEHIARRGLNSDVTPVPATGALRISFRIPDPSPRVTIIVPTHNGLDVLKPCIESIRSLTTYPAYDILVVDHRSDDPAALDYLREIATSGVARVIQADGSFNFSAMMNAAVRACSAEFVCLLNNDTTVKSGGWLSEMVGLALQPRVGVVGAMLLYPDDTIQHGGVIVGKGGVAGHVFVGAPADAIGQMGRLRLAQDMSAVTAACCLVRRSIYEQVGGMDEEALKVAFNDIDFCLKVRAAGYRNAWTPHAVLYHHESRTRGYEDTPAKRARFESEVNVMRARWPAAIAADPAYNRNLSLGDGDFAPAFPPRVDKPWRRSETRQ
ncbi:MAG: glycosyltransferase [Hyphomicrobiaceae bacterium]